MKKKILLASLAILLLVMPLSAGATLVDGTTGWITGTEGVVFDFTADVSPYTYIATLTNLSVGSNFGFDYLFLSISTFDEILGWVEADPAVGKDSLSVRFDVEAGKQYFANIFGVGSGPFGSGNFGLEVTAVPVPSALLLLGSGIFALFALKRKN